MNNLKQAFKVLNKIEQSGFEAYIVGGAVRNYLLGKEIKDFDITTNATPEEIKGVFSDVVVIYPRFNTITVREEGVHYEITTFRTESSYSDNRRPDKVESSTSIEADVTRRDFTMNGLFMNKDGEVIDLVGGITDLKNNIIKAIGNPSERFQEDALRILRGLRFVAEHGFDLSDDVILAMNENILLLNNLAIERITTEFQRIFSGNFKNKAIAYFDDINLKKVFNFLETRSKIKSEYPLTLTLMLLFDQQVVERLSLNKKIKARVKQLRKVINYQNAFDLFGYESDLISEASLFMGSQVVSDYKSLVIKREKELNFNKKLLLSELGIKPGPHYFDIINDIIIKINDQVIKNNEEEIIIYLKKHY